MEGKGTRLVRRSNNGLWYIVWTGNSRGRSTGTRDRAIAERALAAFIQEGGRDAEVESGYTLAQAIDDYLVEHIRPNAASRDTPERCADKLLAWFPAEKRVADMAETDVLGYIAARREGKVVVARQNPKPASDGSLRRELVFLSAACNYAAKKRRIGKGDVPYIPMPPAPPPRELWLSAEQEEQLVGVCQVETVPTDEKPARLTRIWRFLILALETAGRKEAIETLTWFQVDFAAGTINLNPQGRRQTNKRRAVVRMSTRLRAMLERANREKVSGYVLDHPGAIRTSFETLAARAKMPWVSPHVLRHTWATRAAQAGVPMREIADWLGDTIQTVERNYYKRSPHYLKSAIDWREREGDRATIVPTAVRGDSTRE